MSVFSHSLYLGKPDTDYCSLSNLKGYKTVIHKIGQFMTSLFLLLFLNFFKHSFMPVMNIGVYHMDLFC